MAVEASISVDPELGEVIWRAEPEEVIAIVSSGNLAAGDAEAEAGGLYWSGWLGEADPGTGWFESAPAGWLPSAASTRQAVVRKIVEAGAIVRPHARHLVSDVPTCLALMRANPELKILVDPGALLEPSMFEAAEDHVERVLTALGPRAWGVLLTDVELCQRDERVWCRSVRFQGAIERDRPSEASVRRADLCVDRLSRLAGSLLPPSGYLIT